MVSLLLLSCKLLVLGFTKAEESSRKGINIGRLFVFEVLLISLIVPSEEFAYQAVQRNEGIDYDRLDGLWFFRTDPPGSKPGQTEEWFKKDFSNPAHFQERRLAPVPGSFNDLFPELRNYGGYVYYQKHIYIPKRNTRFDIFRIRFENIEPDSLVYLNDSLICNTHQRLHTTFECNLNTATMQKHGMLRLTIVIREALHTHTLPQAREGFGKAKPLKQRDLTNILGKRKISKGGDKTAAVTSNNDGFHYRGILGSVYVIKAKNYVSRLQIATNHTGWIKVYAQFASTPTFEIAIYSVGKKREQLYMVRQNRDFETVIQNIKPWYPKGLGKSVLYEIEVKIFSTGEYTSDVLDVYRQKFGFRTITWEKNQLHINGIPVYCRGFTIHEESPLYGSAPNRAAMIKDLNTIEWAGANCLYSAYKPISKEWLDECDRRGLLVVQSFGMQRFYNPGLYGTHAEYFQDIQYRDQNHPSIIVWASESNHLSIQHNMESSFISTNAHIDTQKRPRIISGIFEGMKAFERATIDRKKELYGLDVFWNTTQNPETLTNTWRNQINESKRLWPSPLLITGYGLDKEENSPSSLLEYRSQISSLMDSHTIIDEFRRKNNTIAGEFYMELNDYRPFYGRGFIMDRGSFTRDRQPKLEAHMISERYRKLIQEKP